MKFVTYEYQRQEKIGIINGERIFPLDEINPGPAYQINTMLDLIKSGPECIRALENQIVPAKAEHYLPVGAVKLLAPIPYPLRNIICLGKNYAEHAQEIKITKISDDFVPDAPIYFTKTAAPAISTGEEIQFSSSVTGQVDYEVELAVVIGKEGTNIAPDEVEEYIFGYTVINDVSARDLQVKHKQWFKAKSLDTFCPMGPVIVHKDEIPFPVELDIRCKVNGELRQNSNTGNMIFDIPTILSDLSQGFTLRPGDIISTGTPGGVGMGFEPVKTLKDGDLIECYIEKIGVLINKVSVIA